MATASPAKSNDTLITYVGDMHAVVTHGIQAIRRQVDNLRDAGHPEALSLCQEFQRVLESQAASLDARVKALGGSTAKPLKDAVTAVAGFAAGLFNAMRPEEAAKSIRDDYTFLSLVNISYLMLHTTSAGLGDRETAAIAERGYRETARLVMEIDRLLPNVVIQELRQDGMNVADVSQECRSLVRSAWTSDTKSGGIMA